ncbi:hypothetical protein [Mesorhizobium opportunistum]|uniref:Uncharacterized protein n=1 Tax=Mesorhizobium opportunistum (strain LMG 24607 / HAMBI 3007 / WSM2075) TaxID=536019 RepID=F7YCJ7_MESOW|nr:hypothetical protein [Mesorhizobium opportunistum]AEH87809.1 hypothetical protein Mesop_3361 [Mesorhizobium opportunistum WSM2075]
MRSASATNYHGVYYLTVDDNELASAGIDPDLQPEASSTTTAVTKWATHRNWLHHKWLNMRVAGGSSEFSRSDSKNFSALFSAIDAMLALPEGFSDGVDKNTALDAERVLAFIESSGADAPKIFAHGGDAVVFTWDKEFISRYVTISDGDAAFLVVNKLTKMQCPYQIVPLDAPEISGLLESLSSPLKATSNAE